MKLLVSTDAHTFVTPDGKHWCSSIYGYDFWKRYLSVFDEVRIVARMKSVPEVKNGLLIDGPNVEVYGIPFFQGPKQLGKCIVDIWKRLKDVDNGCDAALLRIPSVTAQLTYRRLKRGVPLAVEVVDDLTDDREDKKTRFFNGLISYDVKSICRKANGVSYVTENTIQSHYPSRAHLEGESNNYFESYYSTITLNDDAFYGCRQYSKKNGLVAALSSVTMNSDRKGEKVLISAVKVARDKGVDLSAVLIGDGTKRTEFQAYAEALGVSEYVRFTGLLASPDEVRKTLEQCDIYVLPTKNEGLPRGILEAMAIGMPVLSTPVGGIPELIDKKYLFEPDDVNGIADELCRLAGNPVELNKMSKENYKKSLGYKNDILQTRRNEFYKKLRMIAENRFNR